MSASGDTRSDMEKQRQTLQNFVVMGSSAAISLVAIVAILATVNGLVTGGPIFENWVFFWTDGIPGVVSGPLQMLLVLGIVLVAAYVFEFQGIRTTVPFWVGLGVMLLLVSEFLLPGWVTGAFGSLGIIETVLGMHPSELNVVRTAILGATFIVLYYMILLRIEGARETTTQGSSNLSGILSLTRRRIQRLLSQYMDIAVALGTFAGAAFAIITTNTGGAFAEFIGGVFGIVETAPVWSGYIGTLLTYWANYMIDAIPLDFTHRQFAMLAVFILLIAAGIWQSNQ